VKALAAAAATGAATYAVRKALAARDTHDASDGNEDDEAASERQAPEHSAESADDDEQADGLEEDDEGDEYEAKGSADEDDHEDDDAEERTSDGSGRSGGKSSLRQLVNPGTLASASHFLLPVVEQVAESAGRYVAEHAPDAVRKQIVPRFIEAFEKAN
jgi:hypothetical protein